MTQNSTRSSHKSSESPPTTAAKSAASSSTSWKANLRHSNHTTKYQQPENSYPEASANTLDKQAAAHALHRHRQPPSPLTGEGWGACPKRKREGESHLTPPSQQDHIKPRLTPMKLEFRQRSQKPATHPEHDEDPAAYRARWDKIWEEVTPIIEEGQEDQHTTAA